MTVNELIGKLSQVDRGLSVIVYEEGADDKEMGLYEIEAVDTGHAVRDRHEDGKPCLRFERGPTSQEYAFITITRDF